MKSNLQKHSAALDLSGQKNPADGTVVLIVDDEQDFLAL